MGVEPTAGGGGSPLDTTSLSFPILLMLIVFGSYALYLANVSAAIFYFMLIAGSSIIGFYFMRDQFDLSLIGLSGFVWADVLAEGAVTLIISVIAVAIIGRMVSAPPEASLTLLPFASSYTVPQWEQALGGAAYIIYVVASAFFVAFTEGITFTGGPPLFIVNSILSERLGENAGDIATSIVMGIIFGSFHFIKNAVVTGQGVHYIFANFPSYAVLVTLGVIWSLSSLIFKNSMPQILAHWIWDIIAFVGKAALLAW